MVNKEQSSEVDRGLVLDTFLDTDDSKAAYANNKPFIRARTSFKSNLLKLQEEAKNKEKSSAGTVTKSDLKNNIAYNLDLVLGLTTDYAIQINNNELKTLVHYSESQIVKMKDADILPFVTGLSENVFTTELLADTTFITYNITAKTISDIVLEATTFTKLIGNIKGDSSEISTANDNMDLIIKDIHLDIESMDRNIKPLAADFPDFVSGYQKNKVLILLGVHHEGIQGMVTIAGKPAPGATVQVDKKTVVADAQSNYILYHRPGKISATAKTASGQTQTKESEVQHRKMTTLNFEL